MARHRMAPADAAWLRMDRPTNLMVVNSVMWFDEPLDWEKVGQLLQERLLDRYPRYTQRAVEDHGIWWEDVEDFDLENHLHQVELPEPAGKAELEEFMSGLSSQPLDRSRPLWDLYVVPRYQDGCALVFRMHHAIADGIALVRVLLSLTDDPDVEPVEIAPPAEDEHHTFLDTLGDLAGSAVSLATHPLRVVDMAQAAVADSTALGKLLLMPPDRHTALRGKAGTDKQIVWSDPIPLDRIKTASKHSAATINDLILAAVAGALRSHLVRRRSAVHDIRAIVPFNLRPLDRPLPAELGNKFGLVFLSLPVSRAERADRLKEMSRRMDAIKNSAEGVVAYGILELIGLVPQAVENLAIEIFASKGTGVMTNVPGPRHRVTFAGTPLRGTIGWAPVSGDLGLGVAIFSYAGELTVGLYVDRELVPDVRGLLSEVRAELEELLEAHAPLSHK